MLYIIYQPIQPLLTAKRIIKYLKPTNKYIHMYVNKKIAIFTLLHNGKYFFFAQNR